MDLGAWFREGAAAAFRKEPRVQLGRGGLRWRGNRMFRHYNTIGCGGGADKSGARLEGERLPLACRQPPRRRWQSLNTTKQRMPDCT